MSAETDSNRGRRGDEAGAAAPAPPVPASLPRVPFSPGRVALIAQHTLLEAARQKLLHFFALLALALVVGAQWLRDFHFGASELKFVADCGQGAIAFFGAALVIAATAQLFFSELEHRTALTLLAKPVWRSEFVLGKFLGVAALAGLFCALMTAVLAAVLWAREDALRAAAEQAAAFEPVHYANVFVAGLLQWLKLSVLAALALLMASFAQTQLFTVVTGFFLLVICHLQPLAEDAYGRAGSAAGRVVAALVTWVFPNFQLFSLADSLVAAEAPTWGQVARLGLYGLAYAGVACALAVASFLQREL